MAAKKKSSKPAKTSNPSKSTGGSPLPKAAFTNPGQRARVAPREKGETRVNTVSKNGASTRGMGVQGAPGFQKKTKGQIVNAALLVTMLPGKGITGPLVRAVEKRVGTRVGLATFDEAAKGVAGMKSGNRVYKASTPFGKTLASTRIMTERQVGSATSGLIQRANNISAAAGVEAAAIARSTMKITGRVARGGNAAFLASQAYKNKTKKKK